jgi:hypothetical protein
MPVMLLDHAGVGMVEVSGDHHQRHAVHDHQRRMGMAQHVREAIRAAKPLGIGDAAKIVPIASAG